MPANPKSPHTLGTLVIWFAIILFLLDKQALGRPRSVRVSPVPPKRRSFLKAAKRVIWPKHTVPIVAIQLMKQASEFSIVDPHPYSYTRADVVSLFRVVSLVRHHVLSTIMLGRSLNYLSPLFGGK